MSDTVIPEVQNSESEVNSESHAATVADDTTVQPSADTSGNNTDQSDSQEEITLTEDDINAILAEHIPDSPSFKDDKKPASEEVSTNDEEKAADQSKDVDILDELTEISDLLQEENTLLRSETEQKDQTIADVLAEKEQFKALAEGVDALWNDIVKDVPILDEYARAKNDGSEFTLPSHFVQEKWDRVKSNPIVYPLVEALLNGEELDAPSFVKALSASRRSATPSLTEKKPTQKSEVITRPNGNVGGLKSVSILS